MSLHGGGMANEMAPWTWEKRWTFAVFCTFGMAANWVLPTALFQEIPLLEKNAPESLCLATYMNASVNCGVVFTIAYLALLKYWRGAKEAMPHSLIVPIILTTSCLGTFLAAGVANLRVANSSLPLYLCCAIGGAVGSFSAVVVNPFLMKFESDFISASRMGGSSLILFTGVLAAIQEPGEPRQNFTIGAYFSVIASLLSLSLVAFLYMSVYKPGLREDAKSSSVSGDSPSDDAEKRGSMELIEYNPVHDSSTRGTEDVVPPPSPSSPQHKFLQRLYPWLPPFFPVIFPYQLAVGFVNLNTWGLLSSVTPFAFANASTTPHSQHTQLLAIAYEVSSLCLVLGDFSTTLFKIPFYLTLSLFSVCSATIYAAALNSPAFHTDAAGPILVVMVGLGRILEAHTVTHTYRSVAARVPEGQRESAARWVGAADQFSTTLGVVISTLIVSQTASC